MKITGLINDEEKKEAEDFIGIILCEGSESVESGFFGVKKEPSKSGHRFSVYREVGIIDITRKESESLKKKRKVKQLQEN